ncbi:MAG: ABC transporter ATP-binding protein [bacterium]|nr:ABC transporter ATP-binding protein [bacterium]
MIKIENLNKKYRLRGKDVFALRDVNFKVEDKEFVIIVGPSGSGKSTLLLTLGGLIHPTSGKVFIGNKSVYGLSIKERAEIRKTDLGFLFQTFSLIPYLTALENVQISLYVAGKKSVEQKKIATQLLEKVGLGDRLDHKPFELSVGQQQRVAMARALANSPSILLADEPTGSLDPSLSEDMLNWLGTLHKEGLTIVMVTHNHDTIKRYATRSLNLVEGILSERNN